MKDIVYAYLMAGSYLAGFLACLEPKETSFAASLFIAIASMLGWPAVLIAAIWIGVHR